MVAIFCRLRRVKNWVKSEQEFVKAKEIGKKTACRSRAHAVFFKDELKKSVLVQLSVQLAPALVPGDGVQRAGL